METTTAAGRRDPWPGALFVLHAGQALAFAAAHPLLRAGTDLVAYFVYFRSWWTGDTSLRTLDFFVVPKPLLVFTLGALGDPTWAACCSALAAGALGAVAYLLGRTVFDRTVGVLVSLALLLDAEKTMLAVRSHGDLYLALFLLGGLWLLLRRRLALAALAFLLSALIKPVTLPCALAFLAVERRPRALAWALVPLAAVPLVLLSNEMLLGSALGPARFLSSFDDLHGGTPIGPAGVLPFVAWTDLARAAFVWSAPLGLAGIVLWLVQDRHRLTSPHLLVPVLFLAGWVALATATPFTPFFRFFWPVQVWFLGFVVFASVEAARRIARAPGVLRAAVACALLVPLAHDELAERAAYVARFARPHERAMAFVTGAADTLAWERHDGDAVWTPVAFASYLMWRVPVPATDVRVGRRPPAEPPAWILYLPAPDASADGLARLTHDAGYVPRFTDGTAALLALPDGDHSRTAQTR